MYLNIRAGDVWIDDKRRAVIVGGRDDEHIDVRINGKPITFSFRYFVRRFRPVGVPRYRTGDQGWD